MPQNDLNTELSDLEHERRRELALSLLKSGLKSVDADTRLKGWFRPLEKRNLERGVKDGTLSKSGSRWRVNVPAIRKKYGENAGAHALCK